MEWSDYCEHCGTTASPKRRIVVGAKLEGIIRGDERADSELNTHVVKDVWICSECGKEVDVESD